MTCSLVQFVLDGLSVHTSRKSPRQKNTFKVDSDPAFLNGEIRILLGLSLWVGSGPTCITGRIRNSDNETGFVGARCPVYIVFNFLTLFSIRIGHNIMYIV